MALRGRLLVQLIVLLSVAFAGCLGDEEAPAPKDPVTGTDGGDDSDSNTVDPGTGDDVDPDETVGAAPNAAFTILETTLTAGANVTFNASSSADPDGTNLSFAWDFGDGATAQGVEAVHVYADAGNYTVTLNVTDADGQSAETNQTIVIDAAPAGDFSETLEGTLAAPNPALLVTPSGSKLETYKQRGGVEDTTFVVHEVTDVPTTGTALAFELDTTTQYIQFVLFDGEGNQLAMRNFPTASSKITLTDAAAAHGHYFVFVYSAVFADADYKIMVDLE